MGGFVFFISLGFTHNFNKRKDSDIDSLGVPYDYGSIMHYGRKAFGKSGKETIIPKNGVSLNNFQLKITYVGGEQYKRMCALRWNPKSN